MAKSTTVHSNEKWCCCGVEEKDEKCFAQKHRCLFDTHHLREKQFDED